MTYRTLAIGGVLAVSSLATSSAAQGPHAALSAQTPPPTPGVEVVSVLLTPAQMAPIAPHVTYVAGQLTIIADNCTLSDILANISKLTGVQIDVPASASEERMAARLGPGQPRDVLVSLLGSTDFNYLLQAADNDPSSVQSVLLIARDKKSAPNSNEPTTSSARLRRRPSHLPTDQAPPAEETAEVERPAPQPASAGDSHLSAQSLPESQPAPAAQTELKLASASDSNQQSLSPSEQMLQGLQRLYEQRKQMIQSQQGQPSPKPASTN